MKPPATLVLLILVLVIPVILMPAAASSPDASVSRYVAGIDGAYSPFTVVGPDGNVSGFDADSVRWIADRMGFEVVFLPVPWAAIVPALENGTVDMVYSGMTVTPERMERIRFTIPYARGVQAVAVHQSSDDTMEDLLAGRLRVGAEENTVGVTFVQEELIGAGKMSADDLVRYGTLPQAVEDLEDHRIDAVISSAVSLREAIRGRDCRMAGELATTESIAVAVRKNDTELLETMNTGLEELMSSPAWEGLIRRYGMEGTALRPGSES